MPKAIIKDKFWVGPVAGVFSFFFLLGNSAVINVGYPLINIMCFSLSNKPSNKT